MRVSSIQQIRHNAQEQTVNQNKNTFVNTNSIQYGQVERFPKMNWGGYVNFGTLPDDIAAKARSDMELNTFEEVYTDCKDRIPNMINIDMDNKDSFIVTITKDMLEPKSPKNPKGLNLRAWFDDYKKDAMVSTAGIRGTQNVLFPNDTDYKINLVGMMLATEAKARVADKKGDDIHKLAASEVRYNSDKYVDLISRVQANHGITTHITPNKETIPIWMASFLTFKEDLYGGEYVTSSHAESRKIATKDLNNQGSQYLPDESKKFVNEMEEIFKEIEKTGKCEIKIASASSPYIDTNAMKKLNNGVDLYADYLKAGVASEDNLDLIKKMDADKPLYIECVGGSAYRTLSKVMDRLGIGEHYDWFNKEEDPFFHGIGKHLSDDGTKVLDESVDASIIKRNKKDGSISMPVIQTMDYDKKLANKEPGTVIFITDPDHDRLCVAQVEKGDKNNIKKLKKAGIEYIPLGKNKVLTVYTPNQSFLMAMNFHCKQLKASGKWDDHPRFIIKTTASAMAWDEWAKNNGIKVVNTPVGFKELANIMKKVEKQIKEAPDEDVIVKDSFGENINLGKNPRLVFAGEESGGMIIGPEEMIESKAGRKAIAMREKSATEAIIISSALAADLAQKNIMLSDHLQELFDKNKINGKFDIREDIKYYDEASGTQAEINAAKLEGEKARTKNDIFYLAMAMKMYDAKQNMNKAKEKLNEAQQKFDVAEQKVKKTLKDTKAVLNDVFDNDAHGNLYFDDMTDIKFVGDGTYLEFPDKYIEIRPSGTDAKTKAYGAGSDKRECIDYARELGNYSGDKTKLYKKFISNDYYNKAKDYSLKVYNDWANEGAPKDRFKTPDYSRTAPELV